MNKQESEKVERKWITVIISSIVCMATLFVLCIFIFEAVKLRNVLLVNIWCAITLGTVLVLIILTYYVRKYNFLIQEGV